MTSFVADIGDIERLVGDPHKAFKDACAAGAAELRRAREAVELHWYELSPESQAASRVAAKKIREMPLRLGKLGFAGRISLLGKVAWTFLTEPERGVAEAFVYATELARFAHAVEAQAQDQERRQRWLFDTAPVDVNACAESERGEGQVFSMDDLRARVAEKI